MLDETAKMALRRGRRGEFQESLITPKDRCETSDTLATTPALT